MQMMLRFNESIVALALCSANEPPLRTRPEKERLGGVYLSDLK